jgi:hypothetical protein
MGKDLGPVEANPVPELFHGKNGVSGGGKVSTGFPLTNG